MYTKMNLQGFADCIQLITETHTTDIKF